MMKRILYLLLIIAFFAGCEKYRDYRRKWVGTYEGVIIEYDFYESTVTKYPGAVIDVKIDGSSDSTLILSGYSAYDMTIYLHEDLTFNPSNGYSNSILGKFYWGDSMQIRRNVYDHFLYDYRLKKK